MVKIIEGMSLTIAATFMLFISLKCPKWSGFYFNHELSDDERNALTGRSPRVLKFNVFLSVVQQFARVYFVLLALCCGSRRGMLPISAAVGTVFGLLFIKVVSFCRRCTTKRRKMLVAMISAIALTLFMTIFSAIMFTRGSLYVHDVWGFDTEMERIAVALSTSLVWLTVEAGLHGILHLRTARRTKKGRDMLGTSGRAARGSIHDVDDDANSSEDVTETVYDQPSEDHVDENVSDVATREPSNCSLLASALKCSSRNADSMTNVDKCLNFTSTSIWVLTTIGFVSLAIRC